MSQPPSPGYDRLVREMFDRGPDLLREFPARLVERGYLDSETLEKCLREHEELRGRGQEVSLGSLLVRKGLLSPERYAEVLVDLDRGRLPITRFGKYLLIRKVARGGMGVVYEAEDPHLGRRVALKMMSREDVTSEEVARFHREATIAAQLRHPNIITVHEVGTVPDESGTPTHFIAMDFIEGHTFADELQTRKRDRRQLLRMLEDVARAVAFAHAKGVIHRDLKPGNILVDSAGRVVLTDFGLARIDSGRTRLTQTHEIMGTPQYMSPEQVEGKAREIDARADVYALGVILYEILTARPPFEAKTPARLYQKILQTEPMRPTQVNRTIEADLEVICLKAMEKERHRRYAEAQEFAEDLGRFLRGEPIHGRPPSWHYRMRKRLAKRKGLVLTVVVGLGISLAAAFLAARTIRVRAFDRARDEARKAAEAQDWNRALTLCEQAGELGDDPAVDRMADECRTRLREQKIAEEMETARAKRRQQVHERYLTPLIAKLSETRPWFYVKSSDVVAHLAEIRRRLEELSRLAEDPEFAPISDLWVMLGMGRYFVGDGIGAERAFLRATERNSEDERISFYLGRIYIERAIETMFVPAVSWERVRVRMKAECEKALAELRRGGKGGLGEEGIDRRVAQAYIAFAEERVKDALRICEEALPARAPGSEELLIVLACIRTKKGGTEECDRALELRPHFPLGFFVRGVHHFEGGDPSAAIADFSRAIDLNPDYAAAYHMRGIARYRRKDFDAAISDYDRGIRLEPNLSSLYFNRGISKHAQGNLVGAIEDFAKGLELDPEDDEAHYNLGTLRMNHGDLEGAHAALSETVRLNPKHARAFCNRANVREQRGDYEGAIADGNEALRLEPKMPEAYHIRGHAWIGQGKLDRGIADFTEALGLRSPWPEIRYCRALAYEAKKAWAAAVQDLKEALASSPPDWPKRKKAEELLETLRNR